MTDKEFDRQKRRVERIVDKWRNIIGLSDHRLRYKFIRENHTDGNVAAQCYALWQYKHHIIEFYMPSLMDCTDDDELEEDILHELCHILIAPATGNEAPSDKVARETHEFATQSVCFAIKWAYEAGKKDKK